MANIKSAIKRAELNVKQNEKNSAQKSAMRTAIKAFEANPSEELFRAASSAIDKAETKGLIHKNKASRDKAVFQLNLLNKKQSIEAVFLSPNRKR
ncbi:30S ribosomal protein S20 [Streptococcus pneumoniae]|nr:30S ribosomal protein S20 [Streptococcus pneumoniae]